VRHVTAARFERWPPSRRKQTVSFFELPTTQKFLRWAQRFIFSVNAPIPATRSAHSFLKLRDDPTDVLLPLLRCLDVSSPTNPLIAGERCDIFPDRERLGISRKSFPQIRGHSVHRTAWKLFDHAVIFIQELDRRSLFTTRPLCCGAASVRPGQRRQEGTERYARPSRSTSEVGPVCLATPHSVSFFGSIGARHDTRKKP
jgi:hypothetical protein